MSIKSSQRILSARKECVAGTAAAYSPFPGCRVNQQANLFLTTRIKPCGSCSNKVIGDAATKQSTRFLGQRRRQVNYPLEPPMRQRMSASALAQPSRMYGMSFPRRPKPIEKQSASIPLPTRKGLLIVAFSAMSQARHGSRTLLVPACPATSSR